MMEKSRKIIEKIKTENIQPIPKWYFKVQNWLIWLAFALSILLGAAAFSVILFAIQQTDFDLISQFSDGGLSLFLALLPFFWIVTLLIFLLVAIFSIQKSKRGYKSTWSRLTTYSAAASILMGTLFFISGGAQWLENSFAKSVSLYQSIDEKKKIVWMQPDEGYLGGTIENVNGDSFLLKDFDGNTWAVSYQEAFIARVILLEQGEQIKLIGQKTGKSQFRADEIRPWGGPEHRKKMQERNQKPGSQP